MRKYILLSIIICSFSCAQKSRLFNVMDYGAVQGGKEITTESIQKAIDKCAEQGGGTVLLPRGDYLVGTLNLRSNVEFRFEMGSRLIATSDLKQYQIHNTEPAGVFYTENADNVSITGKGTIWGQGMEFLYADSAKVISGDVHNHVRQGKNLRKVENGVGDGPLYPKERFHQMIVFSNCTNVSLTDFTCIDSPYWCFLVVHCDGVRVSGLKIDNNLLIPNGDGLDIISSSNVNVSDCYFSCGDDAIVLAGYEWHFGDPGFKRIKKDSKNINISNCILRSRSSAIRIGGWDQNKMMNYNFNNITIFDSNCGINITVRDYGGLENVNFSNIHIETRLHTGDWWGNGEPVKISAMRGLTETDPGAIKNVYFTNITCDSENSLYIYASEETQVKNIYFTNFDFHLRKSSLDESSAGNIDLRPNIVSGKEFFASNTPIVYVENVENIYFNGGNMSWGEGIDKPYFTSAIEAVGVRNLKLCNTTAQVSPANPHLPILASRNCMKLTDNINK